MARLPDHWLAGALVLVSVTVTLLPWFADRVPWRLGLWAMVLLVRWAGFVPGDVLLVLAALMALAASGSAGVERGHGPDGLA